ncbi:MAG TPA: porin [Vicinamibacterales bacterium]|jgi:phosphate-selective porin OprO/OprP|nr:porin [Vicinamibacterales bacterium]
MSPNAKVLFATALFTSLASTQPASAQAAAGQTSAASAAPAPLQAGFQDGFFIQTADGDYRLLFGFVGQIDGRFVVDDPLHAVTDTFTVRKLRPTWSGRIARYFDFKVMPDFGNGTAVVQDAYIDVRFSPKFLVRIGKDKTPIGFELLQGDAFLLFPERSLASSLVPNRDLGVQVQGDVAGNRLFYAAGVFNGIPDGSSSTTELDTNNAKDLAGRLVFTPWRTTRTAPPTLNGLGFALGGSTGQETGALPGFKTSVQRTFFSYTGATADGMRRRITPAVFYYYKSFGGFGEYMRSSQWVAKGSARRYLANTAWEATGSLVLTGEAASDRGVRPKNNFDPAAGHWGALQLLGRFADLKIDPQALDAGFVTTGSSREARSFAVGANWYPNPYIKFYATFERTVFDRNAAGSHHPENAILFRSQLAF